MVEGAGVTRSHRSLVNEEVAFCEEFEFCLERGVPLEFFNEKLPFCAHLLSWPAKHFVGLSFWNGRLA